MNKNFWNLAIGIIAIINIGYTFIKPTATERFFGIEVDIWIYRLIWLVVAFFSINQYLKLKK